MLLYYIVFCFLAMLLCCYVVILLYCYIVILLYCYIVILLYCYIAILLCCYFAMLLYCYILLCMITLLASLKKRLAATVTGASRRWMSRLLASLALRHFHGVRANF